MVVCVCVCVGRVGAVLGGSVRRGCTYFRFHLLFRVWVDGGVCVCWEGRCVVVVLISGFACTMNTFQGSCPSDLAL